MSYPNAYYIDYLTVWIYNHPQGIKGLFRSKTFFVGASYTLPRVLDRYFNIHSYIHDTGNVWNFIANFYLKV